nr:PREDICTED: protein very KIND [Latimeria chalumnae]|eukprot:XP_005999894.1 PREDICTED: protein very KIND [Latimeria chalumnae]
MKSISHSSLFQTLCVTPDTLAFNTNGNVCFMEQLSDDPEGAFVAPEFDITGNTLKAHIYSLGLTLKVASEYVIEPEVKPEISQDLTNLLEQMQQENPEHRPDTESIISLCEEKLQCIVPASICRNLSAIGRRVLSIESVSAFKDINENVRKGKEYQGVEGHELQANERNPADGSSSTEDLASDPNLLNKNNTKVTLSAEECKKDLVQNTTIVNTLQSIQIKHSEEKCNEGKKETAPNEVVFDLKPNDTICTSPPTPMKNSLSKERKLQKLPAKTYDNSTSKVEPARQTIKAPSSFPLLSESNQESVLVLGTNKFFNGTNNKSFNGLSQHKMSKIETAHNFHIPDQNNGCLQSPNLCNGTNIYKQYPPSTFLEQPLTHNKVVANSMNSEPCATGLLHSPGETDVKALQTTGIAPTQKNPDLTFSSPVMSLKYTALGHCIRDSSVETGFRSSSINYDSYLEATCTRPKWTSKEHSCSGTCDNWVNDNLYSYKEDEEHGKNNGSDIVFNKQWISLKDLLSRYGRPFKDYDLWALCHQCLYTLQTYTDFPVYLCMETVYIAFNGEVLFVNLQDTEVCSSFYLAPEFEENGIITEKVCVYGIAAVLWTTAKANLPSNHKLVLPRTLKRLLLDMAKKNPDERPSIENALKTCNNYLLEQGIDSKDVWTEIINITYQISGSEGKPTPHYTANNGLKTRNQREKSSGSKLGFMPTGKSKLTAVKGPVPFEYSLNKKSNLPNAFTSSATHFKPIILVQNLETKSAENICKTSTVKQQIKAVKKEIQHNKESVPINDIENDAQVHKSLTTHHSRYESLERSTFLEESSNVSLTEHTPTIPTTTSVDHTNSNNAKTSFLATSSSSVIPRSSLASSFLMRQDPKTGVLTLVPVQVAMPEELAGLQYEGVAAHNHFYQQPSVFLDSRSSNAANVSLPSYSACAQNTDSLKSLTQKSETKGETKTEMKNSRAAISNSHLTQKMTSQEIQTKIVGGSKDAASSNIINFSSEVQMLCTCEVENETRTSDSESSSSSPQKRSVPSLTRVVHLIQEEFAFDGYLETGVEHLTMGEYILSLKGLKFHTFCGAVSEKFCDLYWDEKLLEKLYEELNGKLPPYTLSELAVYSKQNCSVPRPLKEVMKSKLSISRKQKKVKDICDISKQPPPLTPPTQESHGSIIKNSGVLTEVTSEKEQQVVTDTGVSVDDYMSVDEMDLNEFPPGISERAQSTDQCSPKTPKGDYFINRSYSASDDYSFSQDSAEESEETDDCVDYTEGRCTMSPLQAKVRRCSPGWRSAFYGAEFFNQEVLNYVKTLGRQRNNGATNESQLPELNQQLLIETKNYKKTIVFYQKLLHKEKRKKGSEAKVTLPKVKAQLEEMKRDVQFLELVKSYLEILHVEQWGLECSLLPSLVNTTSKLEMLELKPSDVSNLLIFHSSKEGERSNHSKSNQLQAGTSTGLMSYLYSSQAVLEGYVQQFLYTFRYFCTPEELLQFLIDRFNSASSVNQGASSNCVKVYNRTLDLMQAWVEDCHHIDFAKMPELQDKIEEFILNKVIPQDSRGEHILLLLHDEPKGKCTFAFPCCSFNLESIKNDDDTKSLHSLCKQLSEEDVIRKSFNWKIYRGSESTTPRQKDRQYTIAAALPKPCYTSFLEELPGSSISIDEKGSSFLIEYHTHHISQQLTLLQQEEFQKCHPVHFLNSRALGVNDKAISTAKVSSMDGLPAEGSSVFVPSYKQDQYLLQLLRYADNVSNWISAEIVTCGTSKFQVNLLSKFLLISKSCYEMRNFATAMQILGGLENVIVRQLPAWKNLPSKVLHILEELKAVQMFLKSDNLCLMEGDRFKRLPTIPCAHLLAMHIQQLEIGAFTMANGAYKWSKLRNIAKVASQIHAFQENLFTFVPDPALQSYLRQRINHFSQADIPVLAAENNANFCQVPGVKESRKFQDTLRRIKTTFQ